MGKKSIYLTEEQLNYIKNALSTDETIKLYHNTSFENAVSIIKEGVIRCNMPHSEGHGNMVWFTTEYDDYGSECKLSIDVPMREINNGTFEFVNKIHVVTYQDVDVTKYNLQVVSIGPLSYDNSSMKRVSVGFDRERLLRLANNEPKDNMENIIFNGFYEQYGNNENIRFVLNYANSTDTALNESILNEIQISQKYEIEREKGKTKLNYNDYSLICAMDPTTKAGNAGKYCNWLLQHININRLYDDDYRHAIRIALEQYNDGCKRGIMQQNGISNDIGSFRTVDELLDTINNFMAQGNQMSQSEHNNREKLKGQYHIVGESPNWYVVMPRTFAAEQYFGGGTHWCTVANEYFFNDYINKKPLYITIPKNDIHSDKRMQFYFRLPLDKASFADVNDNVVNNPKVCIVNIVGEGDEFNELCEMWSKIEPLFNKYNYTKFSDVPKLLENPNISERKIFDLVFTCGENNLRSVVLNYKYNFITIDRKLLSPDLWFTDYSSFKNGFARIAIDDDSDDVHNLYGKQWNYISTDGKILSEMWFDDAEPFSDYGVGIVRKSTQWNFIKTDGTFVCENWYDGVGNVINYFSRVTINNGGGSKSNAINVKTGKLLCNNCWFTKLIHKSQQNCFIGEIGYEKYVIITYDGSILDKKFNSELDAINYVKNNMVQQIKESNKGKKIYLTENQMEEIKQRLQQARQDTNKTPTQKQKEAGNYKHGRVRIQGFDISIENPRGSYRSGTDRKGKEWKVLMKNDYGYFTHTLGKDGDAVDVFIGNNLESKTIFCIDQRLNGKFDETKVMLGFNGSDEAKKAYLSNFEADWKGFWKITAISIDDFKKWLYNGYRQRKPFFEYVDIKKKKLNESKHLLKESVDSYFVDYDVYSVINQYISDVKNGIPTQRWTPLINPAMYQKALQHFTKWGNLNDYPVKYIYQWMGIIIRNTVQLNSNSELAGHSYYIDYEGIENSNMTEFLYNKFGIKVINWNSDCYVEVTPQYLIQKLKSKVHLEPEEQQVVNSILQKYPLNENVPYHKSGVNKNQTVMFMTQNEIDDYDRKQRYSDLSKLVEIYNNNMCGEQECRVGITSNEEKARIDNNGNIILTMWCLELLDMSGIYDWMQLPDGSDAWSDFGLKPLFDLISEFDENNSTPEQTLVIINKCLDITHQRGDLSSMFIEGGKRTLSQISNGGYINENKR